MPKRAKTPIDGMASRVFAYGFDAAGFATPDRPVGLGDTGRVEFINFSDPTNLDVADGVIIPQGIFEKIESRDGMLFGPKSYVSVHRAFLLERERQIFNLLRKGKWACFLVGEIRDTIPQGIHLESIHDTDLCKRILNAFMVRRRRRYDLDVPLSLKVRDNEFSLYVNSYGTPTTVLELPHGQPIKRRVIVELGHGAVGVEFDCELFFLPFQTLKRDLATASSVAEMMALAVCAYRRNRIEEIPAWVDVLRFRTEEKLYLEVNALLEQVNRLESQLASWRGYKGILTSSGQPLKNTIIAILESIFDFEVELERIHEGVIIKFNGEGPLLMFETGSTDQGMEKKVLDQLHSHRKNRGLPECVPAVLFINSDSCIREVAGRIEAEVPEELVNHAKKLNILIVRTIDLLFLIRHLEEEPQRKDHLMTLLFSGKGWLKADSEGYRIV